MAEKKESWFVDHFMRGFTVFHIVGIALMLGGVHVGTQGSLGGKDIFGIGFDFGVTVTATQIAGVAVFVYELLKAKLRKK